MNAPEEGRQVGAEWRYMGHFGSADHLLTDLFSEIQLTAFFTK
jgi:hypothetical protein